MKAKLTLASILAAATIAAPAVANEGPVPRGIPHLDHVFFIMMENHGFNQVIGNPSAPFMNLYASRVNLATNYYAVAHPSLTNYLEVTGGSNFGVLNDNSPDWHDLTCTTNLASGITSFDNGTFPNICPITGTGTDAATPVIDTFNETSPPQITAVTEIDGKMSIPAATNISGKTIADQPWRWADRGVATSKISRHRAPTRWTTATATTTTIRARTSLRCSAQRPLPTSCTSTP